MKADYLLNSNDELTLLINSLKITSWNVLLEYIKQIPYGRTTNRTDLSLVITEQKGTCSSKHALLKHISNVNCIPNVKLIIGIYKMNTSNTSKIGNTLSNTTITYIPEAHCYLIINGKRLDLTSNTSDFNTIKNDLLIEKEIEAHQVSSYKIEFHKSYIKRWITGNKIPFSFNEIWAIREQCIKNLSSP